MARKSQRLRRQRRIEQMKAKQAEAIPEIVSNSEMIEKVNETKRKELFDIVVEEVMEIASMEMLGKVEEKITDLVEDFIEEKPSSDELKKMKKAELLSLAKRLEIEGITSRNTKKQIIEAIQEKTWPCF